MRVLVFLVCMTDALSLCRPVINFLHPDYPKIGQCLYERQNQIQEAACREAIQKYWRPVEKQIEKK